MHYMCRQQVVYLCLMSIAYRRDIRKFNTQFSHFKDNTLHTFQNSESKTRKQTKTLSQVMDWFIDGS
jgi:hypothetical protein